MKTGDLVNKIATMTGFMERFCYRLYNFDEPLQMENKDFKEILTYSELTDEFITDLSDEEANYLALYIFSEVAKQNVYKIHCLSDGHGLFVLNFIDAINGRIGSLYSESIDMDIRIHLISVGNACLGSDDIVFSK